MPVPPHSVPLASGLTYQYKYSVYRNLNTYLLNHLVAVSDCVLNGHDLIISLTISTDIIPRSVLMVELGGVCYLLCALGDGCLHYYTMDPQTGMYYQYERMGT